MIWVPGAAAWGDEVERFESDFDGAGEAEDAFHDAGEAGRDGVAEGDEEAAIGRVETEEEAELSVGDEEVGEGFAELECGFDGGADGGGGGEEFGDGAADSFGLGPLEEALGGTVGDEQFWTAIEEENDVLHAFEELFDVSLHGDDVLAGAAELLVEDVEFGLEGRDFGGGR